MKNLALKLSAALLLNVFAFSLIPHYLFITEAQTTDDLYSLGIAESISFPEASASAGKIVTYKDNQYALTSTEYDPYTFGVISGNPAIEFVFEETDSQDLPVVSRGSSIVQVTTQNGAISVGDRITSSNNPGIGMLADKSGLTIGIAQEAWDSSDPTEIGEIVVDLDIKFALARSLTDQKKVQSKLLDVVNLSAIAALEDPQEVLRYVLSAFILVGSIAFSFLVFGRSAQNSILALGRNPLASRAISVGMILNIAMALFIIISGVITSWFVIKL